VLVITFSFFYLSIFIFNHKLLFNSILFIFFVDYNTILLPKLSD